MARRKYLGYLLIGIPFAGVFFIGWILPDTPWWVGPLTYAIGAVVVACIIFGLKLIEDSNGQ